MTIHNTASIHPSASLGKNVSVGSFSIIHEGVVIGDNTTIGSFCELGIKFPSNDTKLIVGADSVIRSHSVLYAGSKFDANLETGHHVSLREGILAGKNLKVGSYSDVQGDLEIGNFVRLHSSVHLGKHTQIGNFVWIFPYVVTTNDPQPPSEFVLGCVVEDYATIATGSVLLPGVRIGHDSLIGANSTVVKDVEPFSLVVGSPARHIKDVREIKNSELKNSYPWRQHFKRGYPPEVLEKWNNENFF